MRGGAAITGIGAISAIGQNPAEMMQSLRESRGGIREIQAFSTEGLTVHHAAELRDWRATDHFPASQAAEMDRTAQLAVVVARQAVADAGIPSAILRSGRVALVFGICAGGIGAPDGPGMISLLDDPSDRRAMERFRDAALFAQTNAVAADLGITGPCLTISTACASSTSALASALTILHAGHADIVVVGGADGWSRGIYAGFYSLGAMPDRPCSPFSRHTGVSFGEGAGCLVIEPLAAARARRSQVHGMLLSCGSTSDAHHITSPNPGGQGLLRAMQLALLDAGVSAGSVGYVNAHGTGTPDNDIAETVAIHRLFEDSTPPVSSSKSFFGHTLGGAGILEFIASLLGMKGGFLPPTLNFEEARPGCDLDYVPNKARPAVFNNFMSLSAAFGGVNVVAVGGRAELAATAPVPAAEAASIVVTGIGVVSPIGFGADAFRIGLREGVAGIKPITRFDTTGLGCQMAATIEDLPARRLAPTADTRRMDALTRFAVVATTMALKDAGLAGRLAPERIGLHIAFSRGPVGSARLFAEALSAHGIAGLGAKFFPPIVYSTVGGQVGQSCQIRGASFTFLDGIGAGLQALVHAHDFLRQHTELDAVVVVAADEIEQGVFRMQDTLGMLAPGLSLYDETGAGMVPGEGAVALVIERADAAVARNARPYGKIAGVALGNEARSDEAVDETGSVLADVATRALAAGGAAPDVVYGLARGAARHDLREAAALRRLLKLQPVPVTSLNGQLGLADATCGLYAAAAALLGMRHGEVYPTMNAAAPPGAAAGFSRGRIEGLDIVHAEPRIGKFARSLVLGSSQHGNSSAVVFTNDI
jgi:3-oxoacyl-[acyl-carrier-protein] synthase II